MNASPTTLFPIGLPPGAESERACASCAAPSAPGAGPRLPLPAGEARAEEGTVSVAGVVARVVSSSQHAPSGRRGRGATGQVEARLELVRPRANPSGRRHLRVSYRPLLSWSEDLRAAAVRLTLYYFARLGGMSRLDDSLMRLVCEALTERADLAADLGVPAEQLVLWAIDAKTASLVPTDEADAARKACFRGTMATFFGGRLDAWLEDSPHYRVAMQRSHTAQQVADAQRRDDAAREQRLREKLTTISEQRSASSRQDSADPGGVGGPPASDPSGATPGTGGATPGTGGVPPASVIRAQPDIQSLAVPTWLARGLLTLAPPLRHQVRQAWNRALHHQRILGLLSDRQRAAVDAHSMPDFRDWCADEKLDHADVRLDCLLLARRAAQAVRMFPELLAALPQPPEVPRADL